MERYLRVARHYLFRNRFCARAPWPVRNIVIGRTCGALEAGVVRVDLMLSVPQMFRLQPLNELV